MTLSPSLQKLVLTAHVIASIGWVGALAVFFAHALAGLISEDEAIKRAVVVAMALTAWFVILPLSLTSLGTGLMQALGTAWGLFRHYWVIVKLILTAVATIVLLLKLAPISDLADAALRGQFTVNSHVALQTSLLIHAGGGLLMLFAATVLAIYKPQGVTRYGAGKQGRSTNGIARGPALSPGMPRWTKIIGVFVVALILLLVVMVFAGSHGPGAHPPRI